MEIKVTAFPVQSEKVKANGTVTLNGCVDLKYALMQGQKGLFISWAGGKKYTKKDGTPGWDSPIYIADEALSQSITKEVLAKYNSVTAGKGGQATGRTNTQRTNTQAQSNDASYAADDIPF